LRNDPEVAAISAGVEREVLAGTLPPSLAADRLLSVFKRGT
jgi:LAO/AO transport system kinase